MTKQVEAFAPATVANLGPGFDVLGMALAAPGDRVVARLATNGGVRIVEIHGDAGALPREATANTAGIAAAGVLRRAGVDTGVELELTKGMPLGSGLGSSAASAAAAAVAVNQLIDSPLSARELVEPCMEAEAAVSGRHADNVAAALLGGLVFVRSTDPLDLLELPVPAALGITVITPAFELPTRKAREALPDRVPLQGMVRNAANLGGLVHALHTNDFPLLARCMEDPIVTPARAELIPGCAQVIRAALETGAYGSSISGAGPSVFALGDPDDMSRIAGAMQDAFREAGLASSCVSGIAGCPGARVV